MCQRYFCPAEYTTKPKPQPRPQGPPREKLPTGNAEGPGDEVAKT